MSEEHNYNFLKRQICTKIKNDRCFDSWYQRIFMPTFNADYYIYDPFEQTGGGDYLYERNDGQHTYHIRIRYLDLVNEKGENLGVLYLMSPSDNDTRHRCVYARITREKPKTVELQDLILAYNCTDLHPTPPKIGRIYVEVITHFLIEHHVELGINRIELVDNAHYRCPRNRQSSIQLEKSRQLEGEYPYYMQFGYQPKDKSSRDQLVRNRQIMSRITTEENYGLIDLCRVHGCSTDVLAYILSHPKQLLTKTLKHISRIDCVLYAEIYRQLFKNIGLKELVLPIYVMMFPEHKN